MQFPRVEFAGGGNDDMPSQGALSVESDRQLISSLEDKMISVYGRGAVREVRRRPRAAGMHWHASRAVSLLAPAPRE